MASQGKSSAIMNLTGLTLPQVGNALLSRYDETSEGGRITGRIDALDAALRMWLIEAGAHHAVIEELTGSLIITLIRAAAPALTAAPGLHHIVAHPDGRLWTAERAARVARLDGATGEVAAVATVAKKASHLAIDPSGKRLYLADFAGSELVVMNAATLAVEGRFPAPGGPQLPLAADQGIACVTGPGSGTLTIVRPANGGFAHQIVEVGNTPHDGVMAPDGIHAFIACSGSGDVAKVNLEDGTIDGRIATGSGAAHLAAHPDGTRIYCANSFDGTLTAFTPTGEILATVPSGGWAHHPEVSPDGHHVYVANFLDDTVTVFDAATLDRVADLETEPYAHEIAVSPDGATLVLPGYSSNYVRAYDAKSFELKARIEVGAGSPHAVFADGGKTAYVTCSIADHVARIDMETGERVTTIRI